MPREQRFEAYHRVWLACHPEKDEAWLRARLREGFQVHHVDGEHGNDAAGNLMLVYWKDHFRYHNGLRRIGEKPQTRTEESRRYRAKYPEKVKIYWQRYSDKHSSRRLKRRAERMAAARVLLGGEDA